MTDSHNDKRTVF